MRSPAAYNNLHGQTSIFAKQSTITISHLLVLISIIQKFIKNSIEHGKYSNHETNVIQYRMWWDEGKEKAGIGSFLSEIVEQAKYQMSDKFDSIKY